MKKITRDEKKVQTRVSLMTAARRVIQEKGIEATQISDITAKAKVAHGTFYVHFDSKETLIRKLVEEYNAELRTEITAIYQREMPGNPAKVLYLVVETFFKKIDEHRPFVKAFAEHYGQSMPFEWISEGFNKPAVEFLAESLVKVREIAGGKEFDALMLAHSLLSMWARLGFRFALDTKADLREYSHMVRESSIGVISRFIPRLAKKLDINYKKLEKQENT
jgi:AcrR family transcriptional regulator